MDQDNQAPLISFFKLTDKNSVSVKNNHYQTIPKFTKNLA